MLIEIAIPNPPGSDDKVRDTRPAEVSSTFGPGMKVYLLTTLQFTPAQLISMALVLNGLFSRASDHEGTCRPVNQVRVFSGTLQGIEDNFQIVGDSDADQRRLRHIGASDRTQDAEFALQ
jgi:hypothetical protein